MPDVCPNKAVLRCFQHCLNFRLFDMSDAYTVSLDLTIGIVYSNSRYSLAQKISTNIFLTVGMLDNRDALFFQSMISNKRYQN